MPVVILYDDAPAGRRALRMLITLADWPLEQIDFDPRLWRFSLLDDLDYRLRIGADVALARIIILITAETEFPHLVEHWLAGCLEGRCDNESLAVIAVAGCGDPGAGGMVEGGCFDALRRLVTQSGADFFSVTSGGMFVEHEPEHSPGRPDLLGWTSYPLG